MLNTPHDGRSLSRRSLLTRSAFAVGAAAAGITLPVACGSDSATTSGGDAEGGGTRETTFLTPIPLDPLSLAPGLLAVAGGGEARGCARPDDGRAVRGRNQRQGRLAGARRRRPRPPARASGRRPRTEHVRPGTAGPDRGLRGEHRHREHPDRPESRRRGLRPHRVRQVRLPAPRHHEGGPHQGGGQPAGVPRRHPRGDGVGPEEAAPRHRRGRGGRGIQGTDGRGAPTARRGPEILV